MPDLTWTPADGIAYKPSWKRNEEFLNSEHDSIWERTKNLPGEQAGPGSQKLYEMAYYAGEIILEIGTFGGRGAVTEVLGSLAANRGEPPQYYGVDIDPRFFARSLNSVQQCAVDNYCLFYHGNLQQFLCDLPIVPTMVSMGGSRDYEGVANDLSLLRRVLAPGTPILCRGYETIEGVRRAIDEALLGPFYESAGLFADSILLRTTDSCPGVVRGLNWEKFQSTRKALTDHYGKVLPESPPTKFHTPVTALIQTAKSGLLERSGKMPEPTGWPYSPAKLVSTLPETLPNGRPWPKISVITASFNQGKYIEQTILSVANQNYPNVEHIICDGGSSDETASVLEKHRHLLAYCVSEKDRGQCHAINKGFAQATGEIVTWLNSDDMFTPGALAAVAVAFSTSGADMVAGICQLHRGDGVVEDQHLTSCADGPLPLEDLLDIDHGWNAGQFFYQPEVFFKRQLWLRAGGALDEKIHFNLDYELWLRFALAGATLKVVGRPLALFRLHDEQKTHDVASFQKELKSVRDQFVALHPDVPVKNLAPRLPRKKKLRFLLFNDIGFRYGAGIAHERVATALRLGGHRVTALAFNGDNVKDHLDLSAFHNQIVPAIEDCSPDVVLLGNLHGAALDPKYLQRIVDRFPTLLVLHDKWLITGRCAYNGPCEKNFTGCDETCPTAHEYPRLPPPEIKPAWDKKRALLTRPSRLVLAPNSGWMQRQIEALADAWSAPARTPSRDSVKIRFGIPLEIFRPQDKILCRELLGLPQDKFILFFSSSNVGDQRKGMGHLIAAIQRLALPDLVPVSIGHCDSQLRCDLPGLINLGYISDPHRLALLYSAADAFVGPSLEEAFGQVFIEAAACGTPSIAYSVGGVPEAVVNGLTGRLALQTNPDELADAIAELYSHPKLCRALGSCGRIYVENEFSPAASYYSLTFALRRLLAKDGAIFEPKISLLTQPAEPGPVRYILDVGPVDAAASLRLSLKRWRVARHYRPKHTRRPRQPQLEREMLEHYEHRLRELRDESHQWFLSPKMWLVRINRNALRKRLKGRKASPDNSKYPESDLQSAMARYYREQLSDYRDNLLPWYFNPKAWIAKINRDRWNQKKRAA